MKIIYGSPEFLIEAAQANGGEGIVFVELNYRLGALGCLSGLSLQEAGGVSNAALYDQRLAILWIAENIHLFDGDPSRIITKSQPVEGSRAFGSSKPSYNHPAGP